MKFICGIIVLVFSVLMVHGATETTTTSASELVTPTSTPEITTTQNSISTDYYFTSEAPLDPDTAKCLSVIQQYEYNVYPQNIIVHREECQLTCDATGYSDEYGEYEESGSNTTINMVISLNGLEPCTGGVCFNGDCTKPAVDYQSDCDLNVPGSVALAVGTQCQVQCVSNSTSPDYDEYSGEVLSMYNLTMPDRSKCQGNSQGQWLCSTGNCLKATHFPTSTCSQ